MSSPIKPTTPQTFNGNIPAVFNNILNPHQRTFSANLREYAVLEPTIDQSKQISPDRGIESAKKRYEKVLAKKNKTGAGAADGGGGNISGEDDDEEEEEVRATADVYKHSDVGVYVPSEGENKVEGVLGKLFKSVHSQISRKQNVGVNESDSFVSLNDCVNFLSFLGIAKPQLTTLKSDLLSCGLKVSSSNLEFKSVKRIDSPMFVSYFLSKTAALSNDDIVNLIEGYLSYVKLDEGVKDAISNNVNILMANASNEIDGIDYLSLYQLGNAASANSSSLWSWDDCTNLVTLASRLETYNEVIVGGVSRVVGGDNVLDRLLRWRVVVNESEEVKNGVGLGVTSDTMNLVGLSTPQASVASGKRALFGGSTSNAVSNADSTMYKPTPKSAQLIRAAFRLMSNSSSSARPTSVALFGNFLGHSWVLSEDKLTLDGDDVGERMSGQEVMNFVGRRLAVERAGKEEAGGSAVKDWEKDLISLGKGYLAYMRGSDWRRTVLDGVFRPLECEGSGIDDLFSFGKCVDVRFGVEDCRRVWNKMSDEDKLKDVKRAAFLGLFCYYLDKMGVDDGVLKFGIEKWIAMEEARAVNAAVGDTLTSSRMASVALLRMDMGLVAAVGDWPQPQAQEQAQAHVSTTLDLSASFNSQSRADMSREEKRAIGDLHDFVEKAKQAKESARRMRVRDEHLKLGYMSQSDRISLLQSNGGLGGLGGEVQPPPAVIYQPRSPAQATPTSTVLTAKTPSRSKSTTYLSSVSSTGQKKWSNSLLHRSAATVIQKEVRRWIVRGMYVFWRSVCKVQSWWRGCWARWGIKVGRRFGIVGAVGGIGGRASRVSGVTEQQQQQQQQQPMQTTNLTVPDESGDMTKMMLQLLLQQQQQLGQLWQQQQIVAPTQAPNALAVAPTQQTESSGPSVAQLQAELEESRRLMESRVQTLEAERDREVASLLEFKEMASNHLRAQNLTIKRLSHGRGKAGGETTVAHGIMDRVRNIAIQSNKKGEEGLVVKKRPATGRRR